jgi:hypothetical protein
LAVGYRVLHIAYRRLTVIVAHENSRENSFGQWEKKVEGRRTVLPGGSSATSHGFPVGLVGVDAPHAVFFEESRTGGLFQCRVQKTRAHYWTSSIYRLGELSST